MKGINLHTSRTALSIFNITGHLSTSISVARNLQDEVLSSQNWNPGKESFPRLPTARLNSLMSGEAAWLGPTQNFI
jgi:hypothetical protein